MQDARPQYGRRSWCAARRAWWRYHGSMSTRRSGRWCARVGLAAWLAFRGGRIGGESAVVDRPGRLVGGDDDAGGGELAIDETETGGDCSFAEEPLPLADNYREDPEAVLIDQIVGDQGLDEPRATVDLQFRSVTLLKAGDLFDPIPTDFDNEDNLCEAIAEYLGRSLLTSPLP